MSAKSQQPDAGGVDIGARVKELERMRGARGRATAQMRGGASAAAAMGPAAWVYRGGGGAG